MNKQIVCLFCLLHFSDWSCDCDWGCDCDSCWLRVWVGAIDWIRLLTKCDSDWELTGTTAGLHWLMTCVKVQWLHVLVWGRRTSHHLPVGCSSRGMSFHILWKVILLSKSYQFTPGIGAWTHPLIFLTICQYSSFGDWFCEKCGLNSYCLMSNGEFRARFRTNSA